MVQIKAFSYNTNAQYQPSGVYKTKDLDIINQTIEVKLPSDSSGSSFKAKFPDVFDNNMLPYIESDAIVRAWNYTAMRFWQTQLNFAVWCAKTTSPGTFLDSQNPCICSMYTIKSAASCLSSKHLCWRHNPGMPLITHSCKILWKNLRWIQRRRKHRLGPEAWSKWWSWCYFYLRHTHRVSAP